MNFFFLFLEFWNFGILGILGIFKILVNFFFFLGILTRVCVCVISRVMINQTARERERERVWASFKSLFYFVYMSLLNAATSFGGSELLI